MSAETVPASIPEPPEQEERPGLRSLLLTLQRLSSLVQDREEYDDEFLAPTEAAYNAAWEILAEAAILCRAPTPPGSPAPLGDGGLVVEFNQASRAIRLMMPASVEGAYLYCRGLDEKAVQPATGTDLARLLARMAEA